MPPRKKITKAANTKSVKGKVEQNKVLIQRTERVPVSSLKMYHKNPRVGNVDLIAKSLHLNGQFKPIVVNIGTHTGRPNEILAGNHTWLGARRDVTWDEQVGDEVVPMHKDQWESIVASFVDVDEQQAAKIVLVDNKAADEGTYDDAIIAELFRNLPDVAGTGFSNMEVDDILAQASRVIEETTGNAQADLDSIMSSMPDAAAQPDMTPSKPLTGREKALARRAENEDASEAASRRGAAVEPEGPDELDDVVDTRAELQVILETKEDTIYPITNYWGIPVLREDMILDKFPESVLTWGGKDATPDDGKSSYIWMDGLSSMTGLPTDGRTFIGFFTYDYKFDKWWQLPAYYTAKVINLGVKTAFVPDYSIWQDEPRANHLHNTYKGFWLARFFQEAGLKVIPVAFHSDLESIKYTIQGIPKGSPTLAIQAQAIDRKEMEAQQVPEGIRRIVGEVGCKELLIYAGNPGHEMVRELDLESQGVRVLYVPNYSAVRRGAVFDKKDGAATMTAKQKKELRKKVLAKMQPDGSAADGLEKLDIDEDLEDDGDE